MKLTLLGFLTILLLQTACNSDVKDKKSSNPVNIILLIGDGMGLSHVSTVYYFGEDSSSFDEFEAIGLMNTSSASHKITDSGAGGTALSSGKRTYNGAIGVDKDSNVIENIVEILSKKAYMTGIVATSSITHATPAVFYAHVKSREQHEDIAVQLLHSDIDFFAGGGTKYFCRRKDNLNFLDSFSKYGFIVDTTGLKQNINYDLKNKYGYILFEKSLPKATEKRGNFLPDATHEALKYLSNAENGFFLMVEGSQIDWAGHDNDADYLIAEMLDFNKTIKVALDFAKKDGNTLVIVLADHETGGFTLGSGLSYEESEKDYNKILPTFATKGHSASLIPVFAYGPNSDKFTGIYKNTDVFLKLLQLFETK